MTGLMQGIKRSLTIFALAGLSLIKPLYAQEISAENLKQGFVMNFYPILDESKPMQITGRPIASLVYNDGFPFSYYKPFEMQPALDKYRDRWWLLTFEGYLNLPDNGDYTFATTLFSGDGEATCGTEISLNGVNISKLSHLKDKGSRNAYKDIPLAAGLYPILIKYSCVSRYPKPIPQLELSVRGPRDAMLTPFAAKNVYHLVN